MAVVQGGTPGTGMDALSVRRAVLQNHVDETLGARGLQWMAGAEPPPDFVVWPENASDIDPFRDPSAAALIDAAVRAIDGAGACGCGPRHRGADSEVENAGHRVGIPVTGPGERYVKMHPVPFGEISTVPRSADGLDRTRRPCGARLCAWNRARGF